MACWRGAVVLCHYQTLRQSWSNSLTAPSQVPWIGSRPHDRELLVFYGLRIALFVGFPRLYLFVRRLGRRLLNRRRYHQDSTDLLMVMLTVWIGSSGLPPGPNSPRCLAKLSNDLTLSCSLIFTLRTTLAFLPLPST